MCAVGATTATRATRPADSSACATRRPNVVLPAAGVAEARNASPSWSSKDSRAASCHTRRGRHAGQPGSDLRAESALTRRGKLGAGPDGSERSRVRRSTVRRERTPMSRLVVRLGLSALLGLAVAAPAAVAADVRVSAGSPPAPFSQNKQNEPAVAIDAAHPNVLAAGGNDEIDMEACNAGDPRTCPFTPDVGSSGVYFSFDGGTSWTQPTYTGLTGRDCLGPAECPAHSGPIGTLPGYREAGLVSDGDPAVAFGPRRAADGRVSWGNGSRRLLAGRGARR